MCFYKLNRILPMGQRFSLSLNRRPQRAWTAIVYWYNRRLQHLRVCSHEVLATYNLSRRSGFRILLVLCLLIYVYRLLVRSASVLGWAWLFNLVYRTLPSFLPARTTSRSSRLVEKNFFSRSSASLWHLDYHSRRIHLDECDNCTPVHWQLAHESTRNSLT